MNLLPCSHDPVAVAQIEPTVDLLRSLDRKYPDVLRAENIVPDDYHGKKVFRSAVETIRGTYIASSITGRHGMVEAVLQGLKDRHEIDDFSRTGTKNRFDFHVLFSRNPNVGAALEVKGGEGNSVNISDRPIWAQEFLVWCHLDGAITNQPSHGAHSIVFSRLTSELVKRGKLVDALIIRDSLCGTPLRPCPKYPPNVDAERIAPDIFLFPRSVPSLTNPDPPLHTLDTLRLPKMILDSYGVVEDDYQKHLWQVRVRISEKDVRGKKKTIRQTTVSHQGAVLEDQASHV